MALYSFRLPDIGEGIAEAEIVAWHVAVGDMVQEDSPLVDMMTDKATVEMEAPVTGKVIELAGEVGDMVSIGATLAVIEMVGDEASDVPVPPSEPVEDLAPENAGNEIVSVDYAEETAKAEAQSEVHATDTTEQHMIHAKVTASPAVRARAQALGIDLDQVPSEMGRIRHADLDAYLRYQGHQGYSSREVEVAADKPIKVVGLRRKIAENMAASKRAIPHFTYVEEVDVTQLEALRAQLNETRGNRPKLTMLPFVISAICRTLPDYPMINARYDDEAGVVTQYGAVHMGMATQTDGGLMVPVIRDAHNLNVWQLASEIKRLSDAARNGKAKPQELSGSTLTITSLGPFGGIATTPVINRPEVAIIGPNKIVERPIFVTNDQGIEEIRKAKLMNISISCDHRVVDGWDAANYVQALKRVLEQPIQLFAF